MGERTAIAWTDATWNPWYGCKKVSPGCAHCYMFRDMARYGRNPEIVTRSKTKFAEPLRWKEPRLVFTCSWSDWFHDSADSWRDEAWDIIRQTPQHTYQILTKRPERIRDHLPSDWGGGYPNVWLGTSVENQRFVRRILDLAQTRAVVRFVSAEPLLGPVDLLSNQYYATHRSAATGTVRLYLSPITAIHWVIVGGESGAEHRPMREEWARSLRDQCQANGVAFFLKQLGGWPDARAHEKAMLDGRTWTDMPEHGRV